MVSNDARPYLSPLIGTVQWGPWHFLDGDGWIALPDFVEGWDPGADLKLRRAFTIDVVRFEHETGIPLSSFALNVSWRSSSTGMVETATPIPLPATGAGVMSIDLVGARLGGTLTITSTIVLVEPPTPARPGVAAIAGSIVADEQRQLVLERAQVMYPVCVIDFAQTRYAPGASWHLETGGVHLDAPFLGAFLLLINSRDVALCEAISRGSKDKLYQALVDELEAGVASLMTELAIHERDQLVGASWPIDSVGDVLKRTLERSGLTDAVPPSSYDLSDFRTGLAGAVRNIGQGRLFR